MKKILIICGPTATGKTALAAKLARKFNGELISADSRQVYKGMDIVTGKDRPAGIKIHGLDLAKPDEEFSVAHFVKYAATLINQIRFPIIVGGTGMYLNSLVRPPVTLAVKPDWPLRKKLEKKSVKELQEQLIKSSAARFKRMNHSDRLNPRRLIRAIEVEKFRQGPAFALQRTDLIYDCLWVGLTADKKTLDQKIAARVSDRVKAGAIKEWQKLKAKYPLGLASMSGIGYRQLPEVDRWIKAEQQYARRQLTWFKKNKAIHWNPADVVKLVRTWYTKADAAAAKD